MRADRAAFIPRRAARVSTVVVVLVLWLFARPSAQAPAVSDLEHEARAIETLLIAPCCFSQQVSVHQSPAADELRQDIRRRLAAGETRQQILDAYEAQYGTRVLAEPPARGFSVMLYLIPPVLFVASMGLIVLLVRRFTSSGGNASGTDPGVAPARADAYGRRLDDELRDLD